MDKHLLKRWAFLLLLGGALLSSCVNKDYDFDNFDDTMALKDEVLAFPLGTITYSARDIADKSNFKHDLIIDGDTLFLLYNETLEFGSDPGKHNIKSQYINVFNDIAADSSVLLFSNPVFNLKTENKGSGQAEIKIHYIKGIRINPAEEKFAEFPFESGNNQDSFTIAGKSVTAKRYDRNNGGTHQIFQLGTPPNVGPDTVKYDLSLKTSGGDSVFVFVTARLPLSFDQGSIMVFKDTLPVDLTSYDEDYLKELIIYIHYTAKLPVGGKTEIIFLDENNLPLSNIKSRKLKMDGAGLEEIVLKGTNGYKSNTAVKDKEGKGTIRIEFEKSELDAARNIKSMVFKTTLANPDENIHFLPSDFLRLKVELYLKGDIKL